MRKIALIAVVAFAAACGSSTTDPVVSTGQVRFANLSPSYAAVDFCIKSTGGTYSAPILNALGGGGAAGLVFGGFGDKMVSKYVTYNAGTYTVAMIDKGVSGATCATSTFTRDITIGASTKTLVALVGQTNVSAPALTSFVDATAADLTRVTIRFINTGFYLGAITVPAFDIGYDTHLAGSVYTPILTNVAYPAAATGPTGVVNGYALVTPSIITSGTTTVYSCQAGTNPATVPPSCQPLTLPGDPSAITGGVVATAFVIGEATALPSGLFCGDNTPQFPADWPYTMCVSNQPR
jgi:hypothetical protein